MKSAPASPVSLGASLILVPQNSSSENNTILISLITSIVTVWEFHSFGLFPELRENIKIETSIFDFFF